MTQEETRNVAVTFLRKVFDVRDGDGIEALPILVSELRTGQHIVVDTGDRRYWAAFGQSDASSLGLGFPGTTDAEILTTCSDGRYSVSSRFETIPFERVRSIYRLA